MPDDFLANELTGHDFAFRIGGMTLVRAISVIFTTIIVVRVVITGT
jgi:hypothetical protein